jgi:HAD superfamily hydrolase (TIGR01509 family)
LPDAEPVTALHAVVFDMDGLLLDTERLAARAWDEAAAALGVAFDPALALAMVGRNFAECTRMAHAHYPSGYPVAALLASWHDTYDAIVARDGLALKPGVGELLDWLDEARLPRAVATSTRRARAQAQLEQAGVWSRFDALVGGDEVAQGKPAPDIYFEAARRLDVPAHACIALEDSEPGVRAALAAGMRAFMVPDLAPPSAELLALGPRVVASLHDVRAALATSRYNRRP